MISVNDKIFVYENSFQKKYNLKKYLEERNDIQNTFPVINVVGTNGKGSVSNYLSHGLKTKYKKVGLFISPAFLYHNERIQINNVPISDDDLKKHINKIKDDIVEYKLSFFEIWTLVAINYFFENKIDIAVIEAGIGGRKDSTSVFENQLAVAITSIGLDHTEILGESIEEIIIEKEMIAKDGTKIYVSYDSREYLTKIKSDMINNEVILVEKGKNVFGYQKNNFSLAAKILSDLKISEKTILNVSPPLGRFTILRSKPYFIIDGCHNEDGINKMIKAAKSLNKQFKILFATSSMKNSDAMIKKLQTTFRDIHLTEFDHPKSWTISEKYYSKKVEWQKFLIDNINENIIVCGSLYFIPQVYEWFKK